MATEGRNVSDSVILRPSEGVAPDSEVDIESEAKKLLACFEAFPVKTRGAIFKLFLASLQASLEPEEQGKSGDSSSEVSHGTVPKKSPATRQLDLGVEPKVSYASMAAAPAQPRASTPRKKSLAKGKAPGLGLGRNGLRRPHLDAKPKDTSGKKVVAKPVILPKPASLREKNLSTLGTKSLKGKAVQLVEESSAEESPSKRPKRNPAEVEKELQDLEGQLSKMEEMVNATIPLEEPLDLAELPTPASPAPPTPPADDVGFTLVEGKSAKRKREEEAKKKAAIEDKRITPVIGINTPTTWKDDPNNLKVAMAAAGVEVIRAKETISGHLFIQPANEESRQKLLQMDLETGHFREPKNSQNNKEEDARSLVICDIDRRTTDVQIEANVMRKHNLVVKASRLINRDSGKPIPKVKLIFETTEIMKSIGKTMLLGIQNCPVQPYKKKERLLQCYKCQRFGHTQGGCQSDSYRCGSCAGNHSRKDCKADFTRCANCQGDHLSSDGRCPRAVEVRRQVTERKSGQINRGQQAVNRGQQGRYQQSQRQSAGSARVPQHPSLTGKDLTSLTLMISASYLKIRRWEQRMEAEGQDLEWDDIPHLTTEAVNWAFGSSINPSNIWKSLHHFDF